MSNNDRFIQDLDELIPSPYDVKFSENKKELLSLGTKLDLKNKE